ncbi:unnamed protein product, partial [Heterosigma akashiwo]
AERVRRGHGQVPGAAGPAAQPLPGAGQAHHPAAPGRAAGRGALFALCVGLGRGALPGDGGEGGPAQPVARRPALLPGPVPPLRQRPARGRDPLQPGAPRRGVGGPRAGQPGGDLPEPGQREPVGRGGR